MKKTEKGFTIIEVALVLAIGALIFLVIFLAVPALQRNQRNDARKRDISNIVEAVTNYNANNPATALPAGTAYDGSPNRNNGLGKHLDNLSSSTDKVIVQDPKGTMKLPSSTKGSKTNEVNVYPGLTCEGLAQGSLKKGSRRQAAVVGVIEQAGGGRDLYCQEAN